MQNFIERAREDLLKEDVSKRIHNFEEIYRFYNDRKVARQAERCVQCGDPFCTTIGCPLQNFIPQWLEAIAEKDLEKAFRLSNETSPFPEILGRVCPHNLLCEGACTLADGYGAITIGPIEASITDLALEAGLTLDFPELNRGKAVAIIGSGPAGMSCAHFLLRAGIQVEMFERADQPGGLLAYGIPGFKLDKQSVVRRFDMLCKAGLKLHLGAEIGHEQPLESLIDQFDAVFLGLGATDGKLSDIPSQQLPQVFLAMEYLTNVQRQLSEKSWMERFGVLGKRVVVIGGGDTAMDCVRTAVREGAETVTCLYRRDEANMPGSRKEYLNAVEEGVEFLFTEAPQKFVISDTGHLAGIDMVHTRLGAPEPNGRQRVEEIPGSEHCVPADVVIMALGFDVEGLNWLSDSGIKLGQWGEVVVDPESGLTSHPNVYAGGDCNRGADLVVTAAADGRRAALAIMEQLLGACRS
ncbi:MAG: glutamate synthase subunit beta [Desulfuromonadales bacterium]|nr:glutamate synthase subunit beta [Desulfuromonadales bacterium]